MSTSSPDSPDSPVSPVSPVSARALQLRTRLGALLFAALVAGCPTGEDPTASTDPDAGLPEGEVEGGARPEAGAAPDGAAKDAAGDVEAAAPPPPCGRLTTLCADGEACVGAPDCASKVCFGGVCKAAAPADGTKNGDETDVDCGGSKAPACADTKACLVKADCASEVCTANVCQAPTSTDGVKNGDETGLDCGGTTTAAPKCPAGQGCLTNMDCDAIKCDLVQKKCLPAAHDDGIKNLDETGIDCGGPTAAVARCAPGQGCAVTTDCANVACNAGTLVCDPPSATDGLKNGTETDVDCGGGAPTNAPGCKGGKVCVVGGDCASATCNYAQKCAHARSCRMHNGGDTCGRGEVGQAGAVHEDCCTSIPLPDNSVRMDKYEITAGRMREFITATGGQVRQWVDAHRAETTQISDAMLPYLPEGNKAPVRSITKCNAAGGSCTTVNQGFGVYDHLGLTTIMPDRPCANCGQGCWIGGGADQIGHNTYWWPDALKGEWGTVNRTFDQATLDVKSLNCTPQLLLAAFCAWDGGRLPTFAELGANSANSAWGTTAYPWGSASPNDTLPGAPNRVSYYGGPGNLGNGYPGDAGYFLVRMPGNYAEAAQWNTTNFNPNYHPSWPWVRYAWPNIAATTNDTAFLIAAPGRFLNDYREVGAAGEGFYDVGGNLLEVTGDQAATDDADHNAWPRVRWVGGSFEGHPVGRANHNLSVLTKYGKQGGRCVRPM